jgi:ParB-like chromosome segregation protein Spo0J
MKIEHWPLDRLKPYEKNPRKNEAAIPAVIASIREFGFKVPIIADSEGVIVAGHTRYLAAKEMGLSKVPVIVANDLTPAQIQAFRIADNKTAEIATWDMELLPIELASLQEQEFDLATLGFSTADLATILAGEAPRAGQCDPDDVPAPPDEAITRPGDLWILGDHRLLCGDSSQPDQLDRLLGGQPIHLANSDAPNSDEEPGGMLQNLARALLPGRSFYLWATDQCIQRVNLQEYGLHFSQVIVWDKLRPTTTPKHFMGAHELCLYGWKQGAGHQFFGPRSATDLWQVKKTKTEKPVELALRAIEYSTRPGEHVLDLSGRSGSTLIGAEQMGRKAFLMARASAADLIVRRWEKFTGRKAEHQKVDVPIGADLPVAEPKPKRSAKRKSPRKSA